MTAKRSGQLQVLLSRITGRASDLFDLLTQIDRAVVDQGPEMWERPIIMSLLSDARGASTGATLAIKLLSERIGWYGAEDRREGVNNVRR